VNRSEEDRDDAFGLDAATAEQAEVPQGIGARSLLRLPGDRFETINGRLGFFEIACGNVDLDRSGA
jgi:hypothetical protein